MSVHHIILLLFAEIFHNKMKQNKRKVVSSFPALPTHVMEEKKHINITLSPASA